MSWVGQASACRQLSADVAGFSLLLNHPFAFEIVKLGLSDPAPPENLARVFAKPGRRGIPRQRHFRGNFGDRADRRHAALVAASRPAPFIGGGAPRGLCAAPCYLRGG